MENILQKILDKYKNIDFVDIRNIIKQHKILILQNNFGNEIKWARGCYNNTEVIYIDEKLSEKEKRFILAHEFCHYLLNEKGFDFGILKIKNIKENRADNFAMDLLLPTKKLIEAYNEFENIPTLSDMFWVPEKVVEKKLNKIFIS